MTSVQQTEMDYMVNRSTIRFSGKGRFWAQSETVKKWQKVIAVCSKLNLGFEAGVVASVFWSGGDLTATGCGLAARPADDDAGVFPIDADVGVLLAIAAHVIGFSCFTETVRHSS